MSLERPHPEGEDHRLAPRPKPPRIGVYVGEGASHSWIWLAETLERLGFYDVVFLEGWDSEGGLEDLDFLVVGGGDTVAVARALGTGGLAAIERFIYGGGVYLGICAGTYLPLTSHRHFFSPLNLVEAEVGNILVDRTRNPPESASPPTLYGCEVVSHPVRGPVKVRMEAGGLGAGRVLVAPLYGGPLLIPYGDVEVLARFQGFTEETLMNVEGKLAEKAVLGKAAVLVKRWGEGFLFLFAPHFEHPAFHVANRILGEILSKYRIEGRMGEASSLREDFETLEGEALSRWRRCLRGVISNSRIVVLGLEDRSSFWKVGFKILNPEKVGYILDSLWSRLSFLGDLERLDVSQPPRITALAEEVKVLLMKIKEETSRGEDLSSTVAGMFSTLKKLSAAFFATYLRALRQTKPLNT